MTMLCPSHRTGELSDGESVMNEYAVNEAVSDATGTGTENGLGEDWWEGHVVPPCPVESIVGRLRSQLIAWREMGASAWVVRILEEGYKLPFSRLPPVATFPNHRSCHQHEEFVSTAVADVLACGAAIPAGDDEVHVVSPLGVVEGKKLRLILDLRFVNKHLAKYRFRCDGLDCFAEMYQQGNWLVQFDLKSAYHHIEIWEPHRTQELPVAVYFGLRKKTDLHMYRAPRGGEAFRIIASESSLGLKL